MRNSSCFGHGLNQPKDLPPGKLVDVWYPTHFRFPSVEGTETDAIAGFRACRCLEGHYRINMFERCFKCGTGGLKCQDDYASLKSGYWWKWRNDTHKHRYREFIKNLLTSSPSLEASDVQYPHPIPVPYLCQVEEACKGGIDSPCGDGYEGPICGICSAGYHKESQACKRCPSTTWVLCQMGIILIILSSIILFTMLMNRRKARKDRVISFIDSFLSKVKIVIGFYQVTHGMLQVFSFIKWPGSLQTIAKYSAIVQFDFLQIVPLSCLFPTFHFNAFGSLIAIMAINALMICISAILCGVQKMIISRSHGLEDIEKSKRVSQFKGSVYKSLFFFLYITYLSTCSKTASVLPLACRKVCKDKEEEFCTEYLKADYRVRCQSQTYNQFLIVAYISSAYVFSLPAASYLFLWRMQKVRLARDNSEASQRPEAYSEMLSGLRFLFENYKPSSWFWELVEMTRKVILTSGLILVGQESRSYIGLALVTAGMYGVLFTSVRPMQDVTENRMMTTSLAVTVINLAIGAVSRIPSENISYSIGTDINDVAFKVLVFGVNALVIGLLVVQFACHLYNYFKEWLKNPQCSCSCILALLLPLSDLQGEIHNVAETNIFETQLETGEFEVTTVTTAVEDTGITSVTLEKSGQGGDDSAQVQEKNRRVKKGSKSKCHQETQTGYLLIFEWPVDKKLAESVEASHF
ncbi:hypothetical protein AWC38_SpisGene7289 [Stylophora pistillata]|uniref:Uncharacterized protein n=1 Tax=Stylophora pistillata TaxID=50429 RepID=A0A2B4SBH4_STYPI|nr:hypothetical protein AWC38_SpisGene7289 [Stylophora pistillata]